MKKSKVICFSILTGILVGTLNGFFGGGGGMICVPSLVYLLNYPEKKAHATAMLIILPLTIISSVIYLINNYINIWDIVIVSIGVLVGGIIGAFLLKKLPPKVIGIIFAIVMLVAGIRMIV